MTDWAKFLTSMNLQHTLCGLSEPDGPRCQALWGEFWARFQRVRPSHPIFERHDLDLSRTCALLLHGDEGRSQKKAPILCISTHSFMGFGLATSRMGERDGFMAMKLNYEEPTWTTRFLLGVLPKSFYGDDSDAEGEGDDVGATDAVQDLLGAIAADLQELYINGVADLHGDRHHFIVLHCMGDWPWLVKAGCLTRSFYNGAKRASSKTDPKGICHLCRADMVGYPWEDWRTEEPVWMQSINTLSPFSEQPALLKIAHDMTDEPSFFCYDLFHAWHIGAAKGFLASLIVNYATSSVFQGSVELRLQEVSSRFKAWCTQNRQNPTTKRFTKLNLGWLSTSAYPQGTWSKGATSTCIMRWLLAERKENLEQIRAEPLLNAGFHTAALMDRFLSEVYSWELFIPSPEALQLAATGFGFLRSLGRTVEVAFKSRRLLYALMPNYHRLHHIFLSLRLEGQAGPYAFNPLATSTQTDEDFIGRPSRISRRVDARTIVKRTLERALQAAHGKYVEAGRIIPS